MAKHPLSNLTVLDLTEHRSGPYCTRLFAGFGARVIKIERPGSGDPTRRCGPFVGGQEGLERSIAFHWLNGAKESVSLDVARPAGRDVVDALLTRADVVVENFGPERARALRLNYEDVRRVNPGAVMVSISNFGQSGPLSNYQADEMVMYAMSGAMVATGDPDRPPLASGPAITQYTAGMHAYIAALMALFRRGRTGRGEHVDLSVQESALENVEIQLTEHLHDGKIARRNGDEHPLVPWRCYPCRDGYAAIIGGPLRHWPAAARMFDEPRLLEPGLLHVGGRIQRRREVEELIKPWLARHDKKDIYRRGQSLGLAFGYLAELPDVLESEQYRARGFFVQTDPHPEVGRLKVCGAPFRLAGAEWRVGRAPLLGEHTEGVLTGLANCSAERLRALSAEGVV